LFFAGRRTGKKWYGLLVYGIGIRARRSNKQEKDLACWITMGCGVDWKTPFPDNSRKRWLLSGNGIRARYQTSKKKTLLV